MIKFYLLSVLFAFTFTSDGVLFTLSFIYVEFYLRLSFIYVECVLCGMCYVD
jgi:hypothetical protein